MQAVEGLLAEGLGLAHDNGGHDPGHCSIDEVAEQAGHPGGAVSLLGEADGHADGEDEGQIVEDRPAGCGEDVCDWLEPGKVPGEPVGPQHVRLP